MADFTGMIVQATMKPPSSMVLQGKVRAIVRGQRLTLGNVTFLHNGSQCAEYSVPATAVADVRVVDTSTGPLPYTPSMVPTTAPMQRPPRVAPPYIAYPSSHATPSAPAPAKPAAFVDPAILSYARSPAPPPSSAAQTLPTTLPEAPATPVKSVLAKTAESLPMNTSPFIGEVGKSSGSHKESQSKSSSIQVSQQHVPQVHAPVVEGGNPDTLQMTASSKKKTRRSNKKKTASGAQDPPPILDVEVSRHGNDMDGNGSVKRGKGWRQTPLLQPSPQTMSPLHQHGGSKARKALREAQQNGWATEDATDIQDMGDFDFEASHKLFNKQEVFSELRQGDTTADEDRLVSHNKLPRPGTYGGKNLHPTENVLSPQLGPLDSSSDADTELNFPNGSGNGARSSSRHSISRVSLKKGPSRQNSAHVERPHPLSTSVSSERGLAGGLVRSNTSLSSRAAKMAPSIATSPLPVRTRSPISVASATRNTASSLPSTISDPHFAIKPAMAPCPVLLPPALETLESETVSRFGLRPEAIIETAARSIAETAMAMFKVDSRRGSRANTMRSTTTSMDMVGTHLQAENHDRVVVIIAGNHATGARAIAAARHLVTRHTKIIIAEAQPLSPEDTHPDFKSQTAILKRLIRTGASIRRGPWHRASSHIKALSAPPTIIIDALLAGSTYGSLLGTQTEAEALEAREMIDWANRSRAPVLSITCPSGVSDTNGSATIVEGEPLAIRPDRVLALGAPLQGLLDAAKSGEKWDVALVDTGINVTLRMEEAVAFGREWVVELGFVA